MRRRRAETGVALSAIWLGCAQGIASAAIFSVALALGAPVYRSRAEPDPCALGTYPCASQVDKPRSKGGGFSAGVRGSLELQVALQCAVAAQNADSFTRSPL